MNHDCSQKYLLDDKLQIKIFRCRVLNFLFLSTEGRFLRRSDPTSPLTRSTVRWFIKMLSYPLIRDSHEAHVGTSTDKLNRRNKVLAANVQCFIKTLKSSRYTFCTHSSIPCCSVPRIWIRKAGGENIDGETTKPRNSFGV